MLFGIVSSECCLGRFAPSFTFVRGLLSCLSVLRLLCIRNWIYVNRHMGAERAQQHTPEYAKRLIQMYNQKGEIDARCGHPKTCAQLAESMLLCLSQASDNYGRPASTIAHASMCFQVPTPHFGHNLVESHAKSDA